MKLNSRRFIFFWQGYTLFFVLIGLFGVSITPAQAAEITVSTSAELIAAIQSANANTEADTITLTGNIEINCQMRVFTADSSNALPSITSEIAIIGNGFTIARTSTSPTRCRIFHVAAGGNLNLKNVTISDGWTDGSDVAGASGGGIHNRGTVTIINSVFSDNIAAYGGAVHNNNGTMTIINSTFSDNIAIRGAAVHSNNGTVTIMNSVISNNEAIQALLSGRGGGVFNEGTMTITNSTISNNVAQSDGGGVGNAGTMTITNSTISDNSATDLAGGGVVNDEGILTINNSTIANNSADVGAGIFNGTASILTINNSTISGNSATIHGGISNLGTLTVTNSTIANNSATANVGGIFNNIGTTILRHSIVTGNTSANNANCAEVIAGTIGGNNNIIGENGDAGGCPTTGNTILAGPAGTLIGPLGNNGGLTATHALFGGSPAIDASSIGATTTDQRGVPVQGIRDIGAFEFGVTPTYPTVQFASVGATYAEDAGTVNITLSITGAANFAGIAEVYVSDQGTGTASSDADYTAFPATIVTIDCSSGTCPATQTVSLIPLTDTVLEPDETVMLQIVGANGFASIGAQNTFTATIQDATSTATISTTTTPATLDPLANGQFTVDLGAVNETGANITLTYNVGGTAIAGTDYTTLAGSVSVPDGTQTATIDVVPLLAALVDKTVQVTLTGTSNANVTVDATPATVTISPTTTTATITATTPDAVFSPLANGQFTVDLGALNDTGADITLTYNVGGTAIADTDYTALTGSVIVLDGQQTATIDVIPLLPTLGATIEVTLNSASIGSVSVDATPAIVTITTTPPTGGGGTDDMGSTDDAQPGTPGSPRLILTGLSVAGIQGEGVPNPGQDVQWQFSIFNNTDQPVNDLIARVTFPDDDMQGISANSSKGVNGTFSRGSLIVDFNLGTIQAGETITLSIVTRLPNRAGIFNGTLTVNASRDNATLSLLTVSQLPATGEAPPWAVRLRQLLGLE